MTRTRFDKRSFTRTLRRAARPLAVAAATLFTAIAAQARAEFGLTCIGTETGSTINFQYRWGDSGNWQTTSVQPGKWQAIRWTYDHPGQNRSPTLVIRYDDDLSGGVNMVRQKVKTFAASAVHCEREGYTYNFRNRGGELFLDDEESGGLGGGLGGDGI
jgi:hypothetical protein